VRDFLKRAAGDTYPYGVAKAIVTALDAAADGDPTGLCRGLMNVVALLSAAGVSRALLYAAGQQRLLQYPGDEKAAGPQSIDEALGRLASASLLTFSTDRSTVAVHRLTMRVAVERQAQDGTLAGLGAGVAALLAAVTQSLAEPWQNRTAARDAIQQIMALHEHLAPNLNQQDAPVSETLLRLRSWVIWCLDELGGSFAQAIEYGQDLVADCKQVLGDTHPDTLAARHHLAAAYRDAGRLDEAIPLFERTLADRERVLGDTHPDTLTSRHHLAYAYRAAGRLDEAIRLMERTLADRERVLGQTHPDTLTSRHHLACAYWDAGRLDEAIPLFERTLADRERVLGDTHPDTLISRNSLATADRERLLGQTHPDTLASRNSLAYAYQDAGRLDEAIRLMERTLADRERVLGQTHPDTLASRNSLARAYQDAGRLDEAESVLNRTEPGS
jgi:tetratricopeptide (TPR) repeat protein